MKEFLHEWFNLLSWPIPHLYHGLKGMDNTAIKSFVFSILGACGVTATAIVWNWSFPIPWWALLLLMAVVFYLSATAGLACERSRGGSLEIEPAFFDVPSQSFRFFLKNGKWASRIDVRIQNVYKSDNTRFLPGSVLLLSLTDNPQFDFVAEEERLYQLCKLSKSPSPCLVIGSSATIRDQLTVSDPGTLQKQTPVRFRITVIATYQPPMGGMFITKTYHREFLLTPDHTSEECYQIT
jgi:hypothetical protein